MDDELILERYTLALGRIREIPAEEKCPAPFLGFFKKEAQFLSEIAALRLFLQKERKAWQGVESTIRTGTSTGSAEDMSLEALQERNRLLYRELLPDYYEICFGNPAYAVSVLGPEYGALFSFLYTELRGCIVYAYEDRLWDMLVCMELFLEWYHMFEDDIPSPKALRESICSYVYDYAPEFMEYRIRELVDPSLDMARKIIMESDLSDLRYLYAYGEYVTENELGTASFLNSLPQDEIDAMARTFTEGYRIGFEVTRKDLGKKKTVNIRYQLGFERMVRSAILQFQEMGLQPVIYRAATHALNRRAHLRIGYLGANPNLQFDYDHKNDEALYLDDKMVSRKLRCQKDAFEKYKYEANTHAGPACIDTFGEVPFTPVGKPEALVLSAEQQALSVRCANESAQITNRYIIGEERSFTIIAYPIPEIGEQYPEIFRETVKINTLDYKKYQRIQQNLIDALDLGERVHISGRNGNETDLTVKLHHLTDPALETNFENCVADVNIPVGEVFTSPVLSGTEGLLHVKQVYLDTFRYDQLKIHVKDGMVSDYSCANYENDEDGRKFIEENILFHHATLPMGEFAIGTNTTAYRMAEQYGIASKLPILIAEKMGPHFAFGDTCYSWAEDIPVYNPDGKEIIARDNERSIMRKEDAGKAYFGCHTDVTIPYDELDEVKVLCGDGREILLISKGKFVLPGTEELNEPLKRD